MFEFTNLIFFALILASVYLTGNLAIKKFFKHNLSQVKNVIIEALNTTTENSNKDS